MIIDKETMYAIIVLSLLVGIIIFFSCFLSKLLHGSFCCKIKISDSNQAISNVNVNV